MLIHFVNGTLTYFTGGMPTHFCQDMRFLASMPELCDVTFLVGDTREPVCAVRAVLAARSRYAQTLLAGHCSPKHVHQQAALCRTSPSHYAIGQAADTPDRKSFHAYTAAFYRAQDCLWPFLIYLPKAPAIPCQDSWILSDHLCKVADPWSILYDPYNMDNGSATLQVTIDLLDRWPGVKARG